MEEQVRYMFQINDLAHPFVKVMHITRGIVYHIHLGKEEAGLQEASKEWFRPLTKKEEVELLVKFNY